jgi:predicted aldo/keto reductase-like oxidoreductase
MRIHLPAPDHGLMDPAPSRQARGAGPSPRTDMMSTFALGRMQVRRSGYGAMQLAGPYAFGSPPDRTAAIGVLQAAVAAGVDHIDTAQYYGPGIVNDLIREALYPYPTGWRSSARSRSGETTVVPSCRSTIRTSCAKGSKTTFAACGSVS